MSKCDGKIQHKDRKETPPTLTWSVWHSSVSGSVMVHIAHTLCIGPMVYINALFISYTDHDLLHHRLCSAVVGSALLKLFVVVYVFVVVYLKVSLRKQCFLRGLSHRSLLCMSE